MYVRYGKVIFKDQESQLSWSSRGDYFGRRNPAHHVTGKYLWYVGMRTREWGRTGAMLMGREQELEDSMEDSQLSCQMK